MVAPISRRTFAGGFAAAVLLPGCVGLQPKGIAHERNAVPLKALSVRLSSGRFRLPAEEQKFADDIGINDKSFFENLSRYIDDALVIAGIHPGRGAPYELTVTPYVYKVGSHQVGYPKPRSLEMLVSLSRATEATPMWSGSHSLPMPNKRNEDQSRMYAGVWTVQLLSGLAREGVIARRPFAGPSKNS